MTDNKTLATVDQDYELLEKVLVGGDLSQLTPRERLAYYRQTCQSLGLNPLTKPFEYIMLNDKLTLYARRDCTDQLRKNHSVNVSIVARELVDSVYVVTAKATMPDGRTDESIGAVALSKEDGEWKTSQNGKRYFQKNGNALALGPEERANAMMKAETKAKRRVTLSIVGLGMLDETELETVSSARVVSVDHTTGELVEAKREDPIREHISTLAPAPSVAKAQEPAWICEECTQEIQEAVIEGRTVSAKGIGTRTKERIGRTLCYACYEKTKATTGESR